MSEPKPPRRLLGSDDIERGLREVAALAAREGLQVLLIGGVALRYYGSERLTVDLDVVAQAPLPAGLPEEGALGIGGTKTRTPSGVPLDWIARVDDFAPVFEETFKGIGVALIALISALGLRELDGPLDGAAQNRLMLGFGIETRIAP